MASARNRAIYRAWAPIYDAIFGPIFSKFLPEAQTLTPMRRAVGRVISALGTDPNRRLADILSGWDDLVVERTQPSLMGGQYRMVWLRKQA